MTKKIKDFIQKKSSQRIVSILLLIGIIITAYSLFAKNNVVEEKQAISIIKEVKTQVINKDADNSSQLETVGSVVAESKVDVISLANGTLTHLNFSTGDQITLNQALAQIYSGTANTTLNNAQTNLNNSESSLLSAERIANETIFQTEIGIEQAKVGLLNAEKSIVVAELGLKMAEDNLNNAGDLREKSYLDAKNNAVISFNGYLNTIFNAIDQVADLISVDSPSLISPLLGAKDQTTLRQTQIDYQLSEKNYNLLISLSPNTDSINSDLQKMVEGLSLNEQMLNSAIALLENTVSASDYPAAYISSQKTSFINLRTIAVSNEASAASILQGLNTFPLSNEQETDSLGNAVAAAKAQLDIALTAKESAEISLRNAELGLNSAQVAKDQQILGAQTQIDNAQGQVNLSLVQAGNLNIKAPIAGTITNKYVELGAEVNPGQKIAEISQTNNLKIIVNLSPVDIYKINLGQEVLIQNMHKATVTNINPAADPITKKIKIEILFNNIEGLLLPGTFVDVSIPIEGIQKTNSDSIFVPMRAISITQNEKFLFVAETNIAIKKRMTIGKTDGALVEILTGLEDGDTLITDGAKSLEDGDGINIINDEQN